MATDEINIQDGFLLSRAIHEKDRNALGWLHAKYYPRIKRYIASRIKTIPDAEDLAQGVFLELCKGNARYDDHREPEAYLFGMARNLVSRYYRNRKKQPQTVQIETVRELIASYDEHQAPPVSLTQLRKLLEDATGQLPPKAKEAIRARLIEGLSVKEAARKCGCSTDAFYKCLDAALKALEVMKKTGDIKPDDTANL